MPAATKLLVVDDHPTLRHGLISMLTAFGDQFQIVGEAANGEEALLKYAACTPDVVVTDLHFAPRDRTDGIDLVLELREQYPQVQVLLLTADLNDESLLLAHDVGVNAFLSKHASATEIAKAIDAVTSGFTHFPSRLREVLGKRQAEPQLTERELQILPLVAQGMTAKQIAKELTRLDPDNPIVDRTVESHKGNIKRRIGLTSPHALLLYSIEHGKKVRR